MKARDVRGFYSRSDILILAITEGYQPLTERTKILRDNLVNMGEREITLNRKKLAQTIFGYERMGDKLNDMLPHVVAKYLNLADAIIAAEADIIESPTKDGQ